MSANVRVALSLVIVVTAAACQNSKSDSARSASRVQMDQALFAAAAPRAARADSVSLADLPAPPLGLVRNASLGGRPAAAHQSPEPASAAEVVPGSMLVRTGKASLQVDSLETGIGRIRDMARRTGAVIANTSLEGGKEQTRAASLELRIPSDRFDEAVNGLSPIGKLESVNVSVEDVGEEFVDMQARMVNARRLEQRLIELLANRTGKLTDVLKVEGELARVREEIERYEGRLRYLHSRASVSTLTIAVHESYPIVANAGSHPMRDAFAQAGRNLVSVTAGLIASLGVIIPIGVLLGAFLLIGRRFLATHGLRIPEKASGAERA